MLVHPNAFFVWKFGLALTIKRTLNFANLYEQNKFDFTFEKVNAAFKEYSDIYESQTDSRYKARSLVEMGELVNKITSQGDVVGPQANSDLLKRPVEEYFIEALELCDSDPFVLQRCGKYYRYQKNFDKSIELLRKSIERKCDSYGHHHLALALKKKLENSLRLSYSRRSGPHRRPSNSRRGRKPRDSGGVSNQRKFQTRGYTGWQYSADVEPANTYLSQDQLDSGAQNFHETLSSVAKSSTSALRHNQRKPEPGGFMPSETNPYFDVTTEFEEKLNLFTEASRGHYALRFSRQRSRVRSNRGRGGSCGNLKSSKSMDNHSENNRSQSRLSGSPQRCEEKIKQTELKELLVKSPQSVISLEDAEEHEVAEILDHLDKAYQINGNIAALYDKGLTLRALGRYDDALTVFKLFFGEDRPPLVYLAKAYEQSAFCMISKLETLSNLEQREREKITCNLQHCLSTCIEISYKTIIQKYPDFNYSWASQPVLEDILDKKERTKESREELCDFNRKVQDFTKAIYFAEDLLKLEGDQEEQRAIRMRMVSDYYNLQQYDNAILTINLIGNQMDDLSLFHKVHLEGGFQSYMKDEFELAKIRLKTALIRGCGKEQCVSDEEEKEVDHNDLFILCSETNEDCPRQVKQGLENLGLQVTVNFDDLRPYESKSGVDKVMKNSSHFICFLEQGNTSIEYAHMVYWLDVIKYVHVERGSGQILFIKRDQISDIPTSFAHFPSMEYKDDMADVAQGTKMGKSQLQWLKTLLQKLVKNSHL